MHNNWRLKCKLLMAKLLIKFGKLTHADYTAAEISELISPHLPSTFAIEVPAGNGELTLLEAEVSIGYKNSTVSVQLLGSLLVESMGNPIYRAHVVINLEATPFYDTETKVVKLSQLDMENVRLINDEYAILKDTQHILSAFVPRPFQNLLTGTVKSALGLITGGGSDAAANYLKLYLTGSKQKILEYHKPQLSSLVAELVHDEDLQYPLDTSDWEEYLFSLYGKEVVVEEGQLRFKF